MDILYEACAGLDVHKASVSACVRRIDAGGQVVSEVREFNTMTEGILRMGDWMEAQGVRHAAMESTGVYWKPIWNLLEERFELILCNARDVKIVPDLRRPGWTMNVSHSIGVDNTWKNNDEYAFPGYDGGTTTWG